MFSVISNSVDETIAIGYRLAKVLKKGDVVTLSGDLGAGKTHLVSGILEFYNKKEEISSPTFTIINEYDLNEGLKLFHFDVYRLESSDEFLEIGGDELFEKGISIIEWGEKINDVLPSNTLKIVLEKDLESDDKRKITFFSDNIEVIKNVVQE